MTVTAEIRSLPQPEPPKEVVLTMPMETAIILRSLTGLVWGTGSTRRATNDIYGALASAGVPAVSFHKYFIQGAKICD